MIRNICGMTKGRTKSGKLNGSGSGKLAENENPQVLSKTENYINERKRCPDMHQEISDIFNHIRVMSDSLEACSQMSKCRSPRKAIKANERTATQCPQASRSSVQSFLPAGVNNLGRNHSDVLEKIIASYVKKFNKKGKKPHKKIFGSREEFLSKSNSNEGFEKNLGDRFRRKFESFDSVGDELPESGKRSSRVRMYEPGTVIPERMIDVILRELKTLVNLSPPSAYLLTAMSDIMFHYKGCSKCRNKIYSTFPWILNRLQKLIKFIITKRHKTYFWPNDFSYLRLVPDETTVDEPEEKNGFEGENTESLPDQKSCSPPEEQKVLLGELEKVDPSVVAESLPGVQLFLRIEPRQTKKRFFCKVGWKFRCSLRGQFPVLQLKESSDKPIFLVLRHSSESVVRLNEKRAVSTPKLIFYRSSLGFRLPSLVQELILSPASWGRISVAKKNSFRKRESPPRQLKFIDRGDHDKKTNERISYFTKNILVNFSALVFDFMTEGEEEKVQMQKVRELEAEVEELKGLMLDVRRNQAELSKILLAKGIFLMPLLRFTYPEILHEEDWVVNRVAEIKLPETRTSSLEALQSTLADLKRKCNLKNRLILTLLKGFESNVPKEWLKEITNLMLGESMEEDLKAENIGDLLRKTSTFLGSDEQASTTLLSLARFDERQSKEEPIMKGKMGADVQDNLKILSDLDDKWAKIMDDMLLPLDCQFPRRVLAYPTILQENLNSSVRRLEYQVSILNVENERLWHEILDLKDILRSSIKGLGQKTSHPALDKQLIQATKSKGKTINITIQIASDKGRRLTANSGALKITKAKETSNNGVSGGPKSSAAAKDASDDYFSILQEKPEKIAVLTVGSKLPSGKERQRPNIDFNYLDDLAQFPNVSPYRPSEERVKSLLLERPSSSLVEPMLAENPHISERELWKEIQSVPSVHAVSEATTNYLAGPSRRRPDVDDHLQSPSWTEVNEGQSDGVAWSISKERELHPIPEDDDGLDPRSSGSINEAIQHLRGRVRSIHKDVKVLKSKNDRVDKALSKLVGYIKNNQESFEEIQKALHLKK